MKHKKTFHREQNIHYCSDVFVYYNGPGVNMRKPEPLERGGYVYFCSLMKGRLTCYFGYKSITKI